MAMLLLEQFASDARFAVRSFRRTPGFTTVALVTLVVGIAAVTTIFSFMNAVYFRPFPYRDSKRIVAIGEQRRVGLGPFTGISLTAAREVVRTSRSFDRLTVFDEGATTVAGGSEPKQIRTLAIDTSFMPLFGLRAGLGRLLTAEDLVANAQNVVISDVLWRVQYGGDSAVLGRRLDLDGHSYRIIGVMQPDFRFPYQTDAWIPFVERADRDVRDDVGLIGHLRPGGTIASARAEMAQLTSQLSSADAKRFGDRKVVVRDEMLDRRGNQFMPLPYVFLGSAVFVLLIACSNVANLFLARAAERRGEIAIRGALGASRWRLMQQVLTESLVLGGIAAVFGALLSVWLMRLALSFIPTQGFPSWVRFGTDGRVLAFVVVVALVVTAVVGLTPAREGTRVDLARTLKVGGDRAVAASGVARASRRGLVVQLAFSMALFVGAVLLLRSYLRLARIDYGYPADRIAVVAPLYDPTRYPEFPARTRFIESVSERARHLPGAGVIAFRGSFSGIPDSRLTGKKDSHGVRQPGMWRPMPDGDTGRAVPIRQAPGMFTVSDNYFALLGLRVLAGRAMDERDAPTAPLATVVSQRLARQLWGDVSPIGHILQLTVNSDRFTVVGIVDDVRDLRGGQNGYSAEPRLYAYFSARQTASAYPEILASARTEPNALRRAIVELVRSADPALVLLRYETMADSMGEARLVTRIFGGLIGAFAMCALLLSLIGIYGVVAYGVSQRAREIGIRMALGGTGATVTRMIVAEGARWVAAGLGIGLGLAFAVTRLMGAFLFRISTSDPVTYVSVAAGFAIAALVACYLPARRVARVDPMIALRAE
jgi:putative ABC transport system permease protein